jgi:hypothetical protein
VGFFVFKVLLPDSLFFLGYRPFKPLFRGLFVTSLSTVIGVSYPLQALGRERNWAPGQCCVTA